MCQSERELLLKIFVIIKVFVIRMKSFGMLLEKGLIVKITRNYAHNIVPNFGRRREHRRLSTMEFGRNTKMLSLVSTKQSQTREVTEKWPDIVRYIRLEYYV